MSEPTEDLTQDETDRTPGEIRVMLNEGIPASLDPGTTNDPAPTVVRDQVVEAAAKALVGVLSMRTWDPEIQPAARAAVDAARPVIAQQIAEEITHLRTLYEVDYNGGVDDAIDIARQVGGVE